MTVTFPPIAKSTKKETSLPKFTYKLGHREKRSWSFRPPKWPEPSTHHRAPNSDLQAHSARVSTNSRNKAGSGSASLMNLCPGWGKERERAGGRDIAVTPTANRGRPNNLLRTGQWVLRLLIPLQRFCLGSASYWPKRQQCAVTLDA